MVTVTITLVSKSQDPLSRVHTLKLPRGFFKGLLKGFIEGFLKRAP